MSTASELKAKLASSLNTSMDAVQWANSYAAAAGATSPGALKQNIFDIVRTINKYIRALDTRPTVGLFGASQAGKSYLVSILGATEGNTSVKVIDHFSSAAYDFLDDINPKGNNVESTGVVTRFTTVPLKEGTVNKPFVIKLFTQAELVKIITNGYLLDFESQVTRSYQFNYDEISEVVGKFKEKRSNVRFHGLDEEDIVDIKNYLVKISSKTGQDFNNSSYWEDAIDLLPYISYDKRWEILQYLWGKNDFFTKVFNTLSEGLNNTCFSKILQIGKEALIPRESSIIDINRCNEIFETSISIDVVCDNGKIVRMAKSILGALTVELNVNLPNDLSEAPEMDFLKEADILDFPGCKSRLINRDDSFKQLDVEGKLEVYKRGKVAFLFEKYTDDFDVNTLITCVPQQPMDVNQLAGYLYDWVKLYVGDSIKERDLMLNGHKRQLSLTETPINELTPLFIVLTMFDKELINKKVGTKNDDPARFDGRFSQNYYKFFGFEKPFENYLEQWLPTGDKHFKNTYPIRNPHIDDAKIFVKDSVGRETGIEPDYINVLPLIKNAFVNNEFVKKLSGDPGEVFDSVATPGHYGAPNLLKALNIVCRAKIKENLILTRFEQTWGNFLPLFSQFNWNSDINQALIEAKKNATNAYTALSILKATNNRFGELLHNLNLKEETTRSIYFKRVNNAPTNENQGIEIKESSDKKTSLNYFLQMLGISTEKITSQEEYFDRIRDFFQNLESEKDIKDYLEENNVDIKDLEEEIPKDEADYFTEELLIKWGALLEDMKSAENCKRIGIKAEVMSLIIEQLRKSIIRLKLADEVSKSVREDIKVYDPLNNPNFDIVTRIATSVVNKFVNSFGWKFAPLSERPITPYDSEIIFDESKIEIPKKESVISESINNNDYIFNNWRIGMKQAFESNLTGDYESKEKLSAIMKLKEILSPLVAKPV